MILGANYAEYAELDKLNPSDVYKRQSLFQVGYWIIVL